MTRQVLIEATIVEVILSQRYQGGVDFSRLPITGGPTIIQRTLAGSSIDPLTANRFQIGYLNTTSSIGNISVTVKLLEEFGDTRVLSSPKMMALNNQTALLKVVDNIVYFEVSSSTTQSQTTALQTFSSTAKTVAVGLVMSVTPQVNEDGRVSLTIRPTVTRLSPQQPFVNDPNPSLCDPNRTNCIPNPVPQIQVREMESVLQVGSGQIIVMGGLIQDTDQRFRRQLPGADLAGAAGELVRYRDDQVSKSELLIFLRPIVVANPSLESDELKFFQRFLPPQPEPIPAKTSAAQ
jgi:general secretion pathway protein D